MDMTKYAAQNLEALSFLLKSCAYLVGAGLLIKAALTFREVAPQGYGSPMFTLLRPAVFAGYAMLAFCLPSFVSVTARTMSAGVQAPVDAKIAPQAASASPAEASGHVAKEAPAANGTATRAGAVANAPVKLEKLATPEEARAAADRGALIEALFGVALALGLGAIAWIAAKRRRTAAPLEALPEVKFLDGASTGGFAPSDIFAKTAAFDKTKAQAETP